MRDFPETALVDPSFLQPTAVPLLPPSRPAATWKQHADLILVGTLTAALVILAMVLSSVSASTEQPSSGSPLGGLQMGLVSSLVLSLAGSLLLVRMSLQRLAKAAVALARAEDHQAELLNHTREGLMWVTPALRIDAPPSLAASQILGQPVQVGDHLLDLLKPLIAPKDLLAARSHLELLLSPQLRPALLTGVNPLSRVKAQAANAQVEERHLSFVFHRVARAAAPEHLLIGVQDVSELVALQSRQTEDRRRSSREFSMLIKAFDVEPEALREFIDRAETSLMEINGWLRSAVSARSEGGILKAADLSSRNLQALKLHAETLALDSLTAQMQRLDTDMARLHQLQGSPKLLVDALPRLQLALDDLLNKINPLKGVAELRRNGAAEGGSSASINAELTQLAQVVAYDSGKRVQVHARVGALSDMATGPAVMVREILLQLLRNAVVHGIETPADRQAAGKSAEGRIDLTLDRVGNDWTLSVRDNGAGVATSQIRQRLLALGWYTDAQLEAFTERQLLGQMFKPGYSASSPGPDGAAAVGGLETVVTQAQKLGGQFRLNSSKNEFTEFLIRFQA